MLDYLPEIYLLLLGFSVFMYAVLDGYDLGVGMLLPSDNEQQRDRMIASIGPFWDANETWLVLAIGILLIAFPTAHSLILTELYLPTAIMLIALIMRGVAFDFRAKANSDHKTHWDWCFRVGSLIAALTQGYMVGRYIMGFEQSSEALGFAWLSALCVAAAYVYIGGAWLVLKTAGDLQIRSARWSRRAGWVAATGILVVSVVNPIVNEQVALRWFSFPEMLLLAPVPIIVLMTIFLVDRYLRQVPMVNDLGARWPFFGVTVIFALSFLGLAYSFFPEVVPGMMTAKQAASSPATLMIVGYGVMVVMPMILLYTFAVYRIFKGKATELSYK
ncbi:cytochrome d ubiquinol oxidase subunit II [Vibrio neptunius]|uniref:Cytochrome d ubiquinol oxidase subunit II n=1 Tax=Vibrio neptunius TaxID=170651 RepID=A0ABS3A318_9VIBR|nr:cytochrome d ubiquinol oxidase subunit II [Vibrio neptunius]MBN3493945.1 cytochrome d ubiquinol oxidase subunit II [Vibrio neptunius]MBN3516441.1 cytochrome d ubiquinol oxidase subunit II [Vibrio neptunius]MBN3550587.1 cytochrome d ubiquinol oxidase subunit II [Vibrio neptunius]MBN3578718.1 cytochrome d ubiquinol oxidase subunit II [Vibrio neptunius]MCH9872383.1 cytochrome d ubiquinol oxidase subunit II [Vibrio neptunius]